MSGEHRSSRGESDTVAIVAAAGVVATVVVALLLVAAAGVFVLSDATGEETGAEAPATSGEETTHVTAEFHDPVELYGIEMPNNAAAAQTDQAAANESAETGEVSPESMEEITVRELGADPSEDQFDDLEGLELTDPFTLEVETPGLAGNESTDYAVTAFYGEFDDAPSDRLDEPTTPLEFDEDGIATVTVGSPGTNATVTTWMAFGQLSGNATLVNNIEVPEGTETVAVETESD